MHQTKETYLKIKVTRRNYIILDVYFAQFDTGIDVAGFQMHYSIFAFVQPHIEGAEVTGGYRLFQIRLLVVMSVREHQIR